MNLNSEITNNVTKSLSEDIGACDLTSSLINSASNATAVVISREEAILCGIQWFEACFHQLSPQTRICWFVKEGDTISAGQELCRVKGNTRSLLTAERSALNFLQTLSAVATQTSIYVNKITGTRALIVDTRKTIPGLRLAQKYAVRCGGGSNHRMGLYDGILIKENHIRSAGGIQAAINAAKVITPKGLSIQVEVETKDGLFKAIDAGARMILLDNFEINDLRDSVNSVEGITNKKVILEASGGITLDNVREVAETGIDRISIGSISKNIRAIDFSMTFIT
tara:strand:- start:1876 stop:2721 length:846 start_codon:yes stop_codon:yes gene_type:complete